MAGSAPKPRNVQAASFRSEDVSRQHNLLTGRTGLEELVRGLIRAHPSSGPRNTASYLEEKRARRLLDAIEDERGPAALVALSTGPVWSLAAG
jgi:hypothetical protein